MHTPNQVDQPETRHGTATQRCQENQVNGRDRKVGEKTLPGDTPRCHHEKDSCFDTVENEKEVRNPGPSHRGPVYVNLSVFDDRPL